MISYEPFWKTLKTKGASQYKLINKHGISTRTISNIKNNKQKSLKKSFRGGFAPPFYTPKKGGIEDIRGKK